MSDRLFSDAIRQRLEGAPRKLRIGICLDERRPIGPLLAEQSSSTAIEPVPVIGRESAERLLDLLDRGEVAAVQRGQVDGSSFAAALGRRYGARYIPPRELAVFRLPSGIEFGLTPITSLQFATFEERVETVRAAARVLGRLASLDRVRVAVMSYEPLPDDFDRDLLEVAKTNQALVARIEASWDNARVAQRLVETLAEDRALEPFPGGYRYEHAVGPSGAHLVVAPDGVIGNAITRALLYLGGAELIGDAMLGPHQIYGNSSYQASFEQVLRFSAATCLQASSWSDDP